MSSAPYRLYYWPVLQGRGEFVRLILEEAGAEYVDVARLPKEEGGGIPAILQMIRGERDGVRPLAPPILQDGDLVLSQTSNIALYLGRKHNLVPEEESLHYVANQLYLSLADLVAEAHDTHHPMGKSLYYEDQVEAAKAYSELFRTQRMPKFLGYFESILQKNRASEGKFLVGSQLSYVDLAMFQVLAGLAYAFPRAFEAMQSDYPLLIALRDHVVQRPHIAAYLASDRRIPFNEDGIFRQYPELDSPENP